MARRLRDWVRRRRLLVLIVAVVVIVGALVLAAAVFWWKPETGQVKGNTIPLVDASTTGGAVTGAVSISSDGAGAGESDEGSSASLGGDALSRLQELRALLDAGMITEEEHERKRTEIVSQL